MFGASSSGFGGFGQMNASSSGNQNTPNTFGTFGAPNNNATNSTTPVFGQAQQGNNLGNSSFGGFGNAGTNTQNTGTGFAGFGQTPQQGPTTFAFGGTNNNTPTFGGQNTSLFGTTPTAGSNTSAFGTQPSGGLFATTTPSSTFGNGSFGTNVNINGTGVTTGTSNPPFSVHIEKEAGTGAGINQFQSITCLPAYAGSSFEELRVQDYNQNRRYGTSGGAFSGGTFGNSNQAGLFGASTQSPSFGAGSSSLFGQSGATNQTSTPFGTNPTSQNTSAFGQTSNPFGGGASANSNNGTSSLGMFGTNGSSANTGLFGAAGGSSAGSPFGQSNNNNNNNNNSFGASQQPSNGLFGNANNTSTNMFGTTNGTTTNPFTFGGTPQPASTFGQGTGSNNPSSTNLFNSSTPSGSTNSLFGQTGTANAANSQGSGGLFGNSGTAQKTQSPGFTFGGTNSSTTGSTPALGFGSNIGANSSQKPFSFGTPAAAPTGTFGTNLSASNQKPLSFGTAAPAQTSANLFGQSTTTTTNPGNSLFGNNTSGGLFGSANNSQNQNSLSNTFSKPQTTGLFGSLGQTQPSQGLFGTSSNINTTANPAASTGLFGGSASTNNFSQGSTQQQNLPGINQNPYGNNPLFASVNVSQSASPGPIVTPLVATPHKKKPAILPQFKSITRSPLASPRGVHSPALLSSPKPESTRKPLHSLFDEELLLQSDAFSPRTDIKRLVIERKAGHNDLLSGTVDLAAKQNGPTSSGQLRMRSQSPTKTTEPSFMHDNVSKDKSTEAAATNNVQETPANGHLEKSVDENSDNLVNEKNNSTSAYWTSPSLQTLQECSKTQLSKIKDLKIGRHGYGQVSFATPVDLSTLENVEDVAGKIVVFEGKMCIVYPDESLKPAVGKGLNVAATITLDHCFPLSKDKREPIRDPEHPRFLQHLDRLKRMSDTDFIDYLADTGTWVFRVRHF